MKKNNINNKTAKTKIYQLDPKIALPHSVCSEKGHAATAYLMSFVEACL